MGRLSSEVAALRDHLISIIAAVEAGIDFPEEEIETQTGHPLADDVGSAIKSVEDLIASSRYGRVLA